MDPDSVGLCRFYLSYNPDSCRFDTMDIHTIQVLEFDKILSLISEFADSDAASKALLNLRPLKDADCAKAELDLVTQARSLLRENPPLPSLSLPTSIGSLLGRLDVEEILLSVDELLGISHVVKTHTKVNLILAKKRDEFPKLYSLLGGASPDRKIIEEIESCIDAECGVKDDSTPRLAKLTGSLRFLREKIVHELQVRLRSMEEGSASGEASITVRNGRYVLPVRIESKRKVKGIIHDKSRSGQTLFIEPSSVVELNNTLKELAMEIEREKIKVLQYLSSLVRDNRLNIRSAYSSLVKIDMVLAKARCSAAWDCSEPVLSSDGNLKIVEGRHPLLIKRLSDSGEKEKLVPLSLEFNEDERTLLVSGPNAGGKTVMLKTIGVLTLMSLCGLHIPARDGTIIPYPKGIFVDIGDEQSIENDLSTFSSHIVRLVGILEKAREGSLVLLDEIGVGTDPEEGVVIARAVLEELNRKNSRTIATTHYTQLKGMANKSNGIVNGSLSFDPEKLSPTFQFSKGLPGRSMGLIIGERLGLGKQIVTRARSYLDSRGLALENLIGELESLKRRLAEKEAEFEKKAMEADRIAQALVEAKKRYNALTEDAINRANRESREAYLSARRELEDAITRLTEGKVRDSIIGEARRRLEEGLRRFSRKEVPRKAGEFEYVPQPGEMVLLSDLEKEARVVGIFMDKGEVEIELAGRYIRAPLKAITPLGLNRGDGPKGDEIRIAKATRFEDHADKIDIRGCSRDEAGFEVSRAIDTAVLNGLTVLKVIHGKGMGVLREEVRKVLRMDKRVKGFRMGKPWEGGSGVTIVEVSSECHG